MRSAVATRLLTRRLFGISFASQDCVQYPEAAHSGDVVQDTVNLEVVSTVIAACFPRDDRVGGGVTPPSSHTTRRAVPQRAVPVYWAETKLRQRVGFRALCRPASDGTSITFGTSGPASPIAGSRVATELMPCTLGEHT
jgi:hypothetical protein